MPVTHAHAAADTRPVVINLAAARPAGDAGTRSTWRRRGRLSCARAQITEYLDVIMARDPSIRSRGEAALHPSVIAVFSHRAAGHLYRRGLYKSARALSMLARVASGGIEIHPGAQVGERFFIDHGCGVVIGETAIIGDDVTLFHQVTLGSTGWWKDTRGLRRHPRLGNGVTVGANATLLGAITVGDHAIIGAHAVMTADVAAHARVYAARSTCVEPPPTGSRPAPAQSRITPTPPSDARPALVHAA
jgi:serine O-acetyltransferase